MIEFKVKKDIYFRMLIYLSMFFLSCSYIVTTLYFVYMLFTMFSMLFFFSSLVSHRVSRATNKFLILFLFLFLIMLPGLLIKEFHMEYIKQAVIMFLMICSGFLLSETRPFNLYLSRLPFFIISLYYFYLYVIGIPASQFLQDNSENFVSVSLFLAYFLSFSFSKKYEVDVMVIVMGGILTFLSLISFGRSGIVTSAFIFISTTTLYLNRRLMSMKPKWIRTILYLITLSLVFFIISILLQALMEFGLLDRILNRGFTDYSREFIISEYFIRLYDIAPLLGGVDVYLVGVYSKYGYNLHNSYLSIHAFFWFNIFHYIYALISKNIFLAVHKKKFHLTNPISCNFS